MKRAGFTMIELIFVIVILGILAAVAIPKLAATRTDAEVSKLASDAATLVSELGTFYTSQGTFKGKKSSDITNIKLKNNGDDDIQNNDTLVIQDKNQNDCITVKFDDVDDGNITVSAGDTGSVCKGVKAATKNLQKSFHFGGSSVSY
ncbi:Type II secretion envelope pseudopilin protein (PulG,guides folded protein to PulD in outer membrane) [hydrothermal vent metagenome]|uniref:Type II secretion envelope pseudopilin protein (PulG,guides folded protein to PulD in outer membrane) n=1 Tax=hydrothermal vent metagenome TaxID=652676 RepID=A0A1W1C3M7_9ZZZZ